MEYFIVLISKLLYISSIMKLQPGISLKKYGNA